MKKNEVKKFSKVLQRVKLKKMDKINFNKFIWCTENEKKKMYIYVFGCFSSRMNEKKNKIKNKIK